MAPKATKCLACGRVTWAANGVHPACRPVLAGGKWAPGMVQLWKETIEPRITALPVGPEVWARFETLTEAEGNVLRLLACGHTPTEVARIRVTAVSTVRSQIKTMQAKLETQSAGCAVALAWRAGWITLAEAADPALGQDSAA